MNGIPLKDLNDPALIVRAYKLGHKIADNLPSNLTLEELEYWEQNLPLLPYAARKALGRREVTRFKQLLATSFLVADTNMDEAIKEAEAFTERFLGLKVELRKLFNLAEVVTLPWKSVIAVFDSGTLTNRYALDQAIKSQSQISNVYDECDMVYCRGSQASGALTLRFIERSE